MRNPADGVATFGRAAKDREALSATDLAMLRAHIAGDPLHACWLLTLCGLRRSELLGLTWSDVELSAGTVTIARGVTADVAFRRAPATGWRARLLDPRMGRSHVQSFLRP